MSSDDIQRYRKLIQFSFDDKDIESILHKLEQPVNSVSTFNRRKLLLLINNSSEPSTIIDVIDKHQKKEPDDYLVNFSGVSLSSNLNNNLLIKMKKLFFYTNFTPLNNWEVISCQKFSNHICLINQSKTITFNLPENIKLKLLENDKNLNKFVILLRSVKMNPEQTEYNDNYPVNLKISFNQQDYSHLLPREILRKLSNIKERVNYPTPLNNLLLDGIKLNKEITNFSIVLLYNNKSMPDSDYCLQVVAAEEVPDEEIINLILKKPKRTVEKFMKEFEKYLVSEDDVRIEKVRVILQSSVFIKPIEIPFRGINCRHLMPDDLKGYIAINRIKEDWMCKICNMPCNPDDIIIDQFYIDLLAKNPNAAIIDIHKNGNFEVVDQSKFDYDSQDDSLIDEGVSKRKRRHLKKNF